jgi:hypothetical protein
MLNWNKSTQVVFAAAAVIFAAYLPAALWLKHSYVEPPKPGGEIIRLERPFIRVKGSDLAFTARAPSLEQLSDSETAPRRSPFLLFEDGRPLGPARSEHADIATLGHGRFSHWTGAGFIFSSSDGTNPQSNKRTYWAVRIDPEPAFTPQQPTPPEPEPTRELADGIIQLQRPFKKIEGSDLAFAARAPSLEQLSDSKTAPMQSPFLLFEDGRPLGPAHSLHGDIAALGHGRFSHWAGTGFIFSSSDGTSPRSNGRTYSAVRIAPEPAFTPQQPSPEPEPTRELADGTIRLQHPFAGMGGSAFAVRAPSLEQLADSATAPMRSPFLLFEDGRPLGPAHSLHADIAALGHGRFSHWSGTGFIFSSSDGTSPRSNGRTYLAMRMAPEPAFTPQQPTPEPETRELAGIIRLQRPFSRIGGSAFAVRAPSLEQLSDSETAPTQSPFLLFEDNRPLGPAHSLHGDIAALGHGRFSHWTNTGFVFSSSDGTNPQSNGRTYLAVRIDPEPAFTPQQPTPEPEPTRELADGIIQLQRPFSRMAGSDLAFTARAPSLEQLSDSETAPTQSPFLLFEDNRPLGPAHSLHGDIAALGHGRFSHWTDTGFIFSSSDGTSPQSNGRTYLAVRIDPEPAFTPQQPTPEPEPTRELADGIIQLQRPFSRMEGSAFAVRAPSLEQLSDSETAPMQSPFLLFEDGRPLGPAHSLHADIAALGHGRFSHWTDTGFIFSSSDGTSPQSNGRTYLAVRIDPEPEFTPQQPTPPPPPPPCYRFVPCERIDPEPEFTPQQPIPEPEPTRELADGIIQLLRPFDKMAGSDLAFVVRAPSLEQQQLSDSETAPMQSPFLLFEDGRPLGPAHSLHADIAALGHGRFSHWTGAGFIFSSSDGTSPQSNGRTYLAMRIDPEPAFAPQQPTPEPEPTHELADGTIRLLRPFDKMAGSDLAFVVRAPSLEQLSDSETAPMHSPFLLFEDDRPLGPAHSVHVDIATLGHGRFSHWTGTGFIFSSSDGTSPQSNGRTYLAVRMAPEPAFAPQQPTPEPAPPPPCYRFVPCD